MADSLSLDFSDEDYIEEELAEELKEDRLREQRQDSQQPDVEAEQEGGGAEWEADEEEQPDVEAEQEEGAEREVDLERHERAQNKLQRRNEILAQKSKKQTRANTNDSDDSDPDVQMPQERNRIRKQYGLRSRSSAILTGIATEEEKQQAIRSRNMGYVPRLPSVTNSNTDLNLATKFTTLFRPTSQIITTKKRRQLDQMPRTYTNPAERKGGKELEEDEQNPPVCAYIILSNIIRLQLEVLFQRRLFYA